MQHLFTLPCRFVKHRLARLRTNPLAKDSYLVRQSTFSLIGVLAFALLSLTPSKAQTKYTAEFNTSPTFDYEGGQTTYKTRTTVNIGGVNYLIHNAINADFTWTGSAVSYNPYSGVGLVIEREDQQLFTFYGIDLNYTSVNTDLAHAPWLTVSYQGASGQAAPADAYNETSKNFSVSKPAGLAVKYVQLYFADVATLLLDNLIVGPATTPNCFNPTQPTISATRTSICAGSTTILSVRSGSLNDATNWKWYSGSCGGTPVGTGSAIQVSPGSTTTYYVRGEGGCVTPGACASQQITVNAPFFPSLSNNGPLTCAKTSVILTTTGGPSGASYTYSPGAQASSPSSLTAAVSQSGPYSVTVSVTGGCSAIATTTVTSNTVAPPVVVTPISQTICSGQTATFTVSGADSYTWSTGATTAAISVSASGTYTVTGTRVSNGCKATATATLTVNPLPTAYSVTGGGAYCQGGSGVALGLAGSQTDVSYRLQLNGNPVGTAVTGTGNAISFGNQTDQGTYTVLATNTSTSCQRVMSGSQTVNINPLPTVSITGLAVAYCQDALAVTLAPLGSPAGGSFAIDGSPATIFDPATLALGDRRVTYSYSDANGCTNGAAQTVTVKPTPTAPVLVTQSGGPYPSGVSNLTISQNVGNVILTVSGCQGGTISWNGGNATTLAVSTASLGTQSFTATCTSNGCTSPTATATVTVVPPTLKVLSRDPDNGQLGNNTIKPYLVLQNVGRDPFAYSNITLRYWLTTENNIPLIFQKNYVAIGQGNLNLRYVPLDPARQGATGYIEYSFNGGAGSLAPMGDSGPLEIQVNKQDYSSFFQPDDYSYINNSSFTLNPRITAYQNGTIFYGVEPSGTGSTREAAPEAGSLLMVKVLGNPVVGQSAEVEISGVSGQALQVKLVDLQGKTVHGQSIKEAGSVERVSLPLGHAQGILLLEVSTTTQRQQIKLLRP